MGLRAVVTLQPLQGSPLGAAYPGTLSVLLSSQAGTGGHASLILYCLMQLTSHPDHTPTQSIGRAERGATVGAGTGVVVGGGVEGAMVGVASPPLKVSKAHSTLPESVAPSPRGFLNCVWSSALSCAAFASPQTPTMHKITERMLMIINHAMCRSSTAPTHPNPMFPRLICKVRLGSRAAHTLKFLR